MERKNINPDQAWKTAANTLLILGLLNLPVSMTLLTKLKFISWQFILSISLLIIFISLSFLVKRHNLVALKVGVIILVILGLGNLVALILFRNPLYIPSIIINIVVLVYLVAPFPSVRAKLEENKNR